MGVKVTITPHVVRCATSGEDVAFDQFQIRLGQRVVGYTAKPACVPKLVVRGLSEEVTNAIEAETAAFWKSQEIKKAQVAKPIGAKPPKADAPTVDLAGSAELEATLEFEADKQAAEQAAAAAGDGDADKKE